MPVAPSIPARAPSLQCKPPCDSLRNNWPSSQGADLEQAVKDYTAIRSHTPDTEAARSIRDLLYEVLGKAALESAKAIQAEAKRINTPVKDFSTTLLHSQAGGEYWKDLFCWPTGVVEHDGKLGVVVPAYPPHFFFTHGSPNNDPLGIKGKEKEGKWFASANNRRRFLDPLRRTDSSSQTPRRASYRGKVLQSYPIP